jgi:hypothetical protein
MFVWAALMECKRFLFLLPVGLALLLCTSVVVGSVSPTAFGQQQQQPNLGANQNMTSTTNTGNNTETSSAGTLDCDNAASVLGGMAVPNPAGVCDIAVPLQGVQVQDTSTGASLNKLLIMNPLFEFLPASNQAAGASSSTTTGANQTTVYGFAEFAMMGGQLPSAIKMLSNSSWNVVAVHNHVIGESPSMIFVHAIANGDINTLTKDTRTILDSLMAQMQSSSSNQTSTTGGGGGASSTGTAAGGGTTGGNMTSNNTPGGVTGGTTTGSGSTAGGGVGTFGGGGGSSPSPGVGTSGGGDSGGTTTGGDSGGTTTGGAAGPQVRP